MARETMFFWNTIAISTHFQTAGGSHGHPPRRCFALIGQDLVPFATAGVSWQQWRFEIRQQHVGHLALWKSCVFGGWGDLW